MLILILLALDTVLALIAVNDVAIRHQLRTTSSSLRSAKAQLSDSQISLRILNARSQATLRQNALATTSAVSEQTQLQGELEGVTDLLQGSTRNTRPTVGAIPAVQGVGATLVFTAVQTPSTVSLTTIVTGATPGRTYTISWGPCPESIALQSIAASGVATSDGFAILPKIDISVPPEGNEFWLRLKEINPPGSADVLGGQRDAYLNQGQFLGNGASVPPTRATC